MRLLLTFIYFFLILNSRAQTDSLSSKFPIDSNYFPSFDGTSIYYEVRGEGKTSSTSSWFIVNSNSWKRTSLYTDLLKNG